MATDQNSIAHFAAMQETLQNFTNLLTPLGAGSAQFNALQEKLQALHTVLTTGAAIAQTRKEVIWALNKAKLYRYIPVVPKEKRHPVPLLLVFAIMNRPDILD